VFEKASTGARRQRGLDSPSGRIKKKKEGGAENSGSGKVLGRKID